VIISRELITQMENTLRRARLAGSLTEEERRAALLAEVPSATEQKRYLAKLAAAIRKAKQ
jgi:hypothetical protein